MEELRCVTCNTFSDVPTAPGILRISPALVFNPPRFLSFLCRKPPHSFHIQYFFNVAENMPFPETLKDKPKVIFFTDFDGTITLDDSKSDTLQFVSSFSNFFKLSDIEFL